MNKPNPNEEARRMADAIVTAWGWNTERSKLIELITSALHPLIITNAFLKELESAIHEIEDSLHESEAMHLDAVRESAAAQIGCMDRETRLANAIAEGVRFGNLVIEEKRKRTELIRQLKEWREDYPPSIQHLIKFDEIVRSGEDP